MFQVTSNPFYLQQQSQRPLGKTAFPMEYSLKSVTPDETASESDKKFKD